MTPTPEDLADAGDLAWSILDRAIARYHEAEPRAERARELAQLDRRLDKWAELEGGSAWDARRELIRAILTTAPNFTDRPVTYPEKHVWPTIGVTMGDRTFVCCPDPYQDGEPYQKGESWLAGPDRMLLVVMDTAAIRDITRGLPIADFTPTTKPTPKPQDQTDQDRAVWLVTLIRAAETLGRDEALRRVFGADRQS